jgi:hypothetical protein
MKRRIVITACLFVTMAGVPAALHAATQLGWADSFVGANVLCVDSACTIVANYVGSITGTGTVRWQYVGAQGSDSTGRANAREQANFTFRDDETFGCSAQTVQISRYRTTSPPAQGNTCDSATTTFVGSSSQTFDSCVFPNGDVYFQHRLLPTFNFSAETATNATIGYRSVVTVTNGSGGGGSSVGCYKIRWL